MSIFTEPPKAKGNSDQALVWIQPERRVSLDKIHRVLWGMAKTRGADTEQGKAYAFLAARVKVEGQMFEFNRVPEHLFRAEAVRGGDLLCRSLLDMPYRTCVFWMDYIPAEEERPNWDDKETVRFCTCVTRISEPGERREYLVLDCSELPHHIAEGLGLKAGRPLGPQEMIFISTGFGVIHAVEGGKWGGREVDESNFQTVMLRSAHTPDEMMPTADGRLASLADTVTGLSMILATKNIGLRTEVPDRKLQQKRERAGKEPLPTVTYVDTQRWLIARENTARGGTHASPVPHLRRGHIRTYRDGRQVWIHDMLVNAKSPADLKRRDHYEVEEHD